MQRVIIRSLTATAVLGGLLFGGASVAAANPVPTATPTHTQVDCPLGTHLEPVLGICIAF